MSAPAYELLPRLELRVFFAPVNSRTPTPQPTDDQIAALGPGDWRPVGQPGGSWTRSSTESVRSFDLDDHSAWLFETALSGREAAFATIRALGYWTIVQFHAKEKPAADALAALDARLEALGLTFDFELER